MTISAPAKRLGSARISADHLPEVVKVCGILVANKPLYQAAGDPLQGIETVDAWLGARLAGEPERPGALRVVYIERQTGPFSRASLVP